MALAAAGGCNQVVNGGLGRPEVSVQPAPDADPPPDRSPSDAPDAPAVDRTPGEVIASEGGSGDRPPGGTPGVVQCGANRCDVPGTVCCSGAGDAGTCMASGGSCPAGGARICDGPEDCRMGETCCARMDTPSIYRSVCVNADACMVGMGMCHTPADCAGAQCCPVTVGPGLSLLLCRATC